MAPTWFWLGFLAFVMVMLALDLGVFHRRPHRVSAKEAIAWTTVWAALAMGFNTLVYFAYENHWSGMGIHGEQTIKGSQAALEFFTGYLVEQSLSLDNVFVIALILRYFHVPQEFQHRVLFWGVFGAVVMRGVMIALGAALIARFSWIEYVFGALLLITAVKMFVTHEEDMNPENNIVLRLARRFFRVTPAFVGHHFFVVIEGKRFVTPLFLVLLLVESTDVIFAVDSVPAIFAVTREPFIVFTSNIFAILGLRSLYFALASLINRFEYLRVSLVFLLAFIGIKMLISHYIPISISVSLAVILGILAVGVLASVIAPRRRNSL